MLRRNLSDEWGNWGEKPPIYWSSIINDPDLHPEIRDNKVTVYYRGAALIRDLTLENKIFTGEVHFKYVPIREPAGSKYLKVSGNSEGLKFKSIVEPLPLENCNAHILEEYKRMMRSVADNPESSIVHSIVSKNGNTVIDQEIKFQLAGDSKSDKIDVCHFDTTHNSLTFVEVKGKHDSRLKSRTDDPPEVIHQLKRYREQIESHYQEIINAYQSTIKLKQRIGLGNRLSAVPQGTLSLLMKKIVLVIGGCTKSEVASILNGEGDWAALRSGVEKEAAGLILCGTDGCKLNLVPHRQCLVFDDSVFDRSK